MPIPLIGVGVGFFSAWVARGLAGVVAKFGLTTVQTVIAGLIIAAQIALGLAIASFIALLFNTMQGLLDFTFELQNSSSEVISIAVKVTQAVGIWDGVIDALTLVLPFFTSLLVIKISMVSIKLLRTLSEQADKVIKTALSHGI